MQDEFDSQTGLCKDLGNSLKAESGHTIEVANEMGRMLMHCRGFLAGRQHNRRFLLKNIQVVSDEKKGHPI